MCFSRKSQKFVIFLEKMQERSALEAISAVFSKFWSNICLFQPTQKFNDQKFGSN